MIWRNHQSSILPNVAIKATLLLLSLDMYPIKVVAIYISMMILFPRHFS